MVIYGTAGDDVIIGTIFGDKIYGYAGNDTIYGLESSDIIYGGDDNDIIYGGCGNDWLYGDNGNDIIYGQGGNDIMKGGLGNDKLFGGPDNDTIYGESGNDLLDGGDGADKMMGGIGDDTYVVDHKTDKVIELPGEGIDQINSSVSFVLPSNVENLTLTGTEDLRGTGNDLDNIIIGNTGNNQLVGNCGDDTLIGGLGNDIYKGYFDGSGDDIIKDAGGCLDILDLCGWSNCVDTTGIDSNGNGFLDALFIENLTSCDTVFIQNYYDDTIATGNGAGYIECIIYPV